MFGLVFLPFALGHYLSSLMRTVTAILAPQLVAALALTPGQLGLMNSAFFFAFALVQLPVGVALDRHGPRKVQLLMLSVAATGALAFAGGHDYLQLLCARALIGLGLGGCFMSAVKAMSMWIAPSRLPSVHGYLIAVGGLGAASATLPVRLALHYMDWRGLFLLLAAAAALVGLLIYLLAPASPRMQGKEGRPRASTTMRAVLEVYRHRAFRRTIGPLLVPHMVFFGMQGLWMGKWLSDVGHYSEAAVAYLLYLSMAAIIFGAIATGMVTEWAGRRGIAPLTVAAAGVALFIAVQCGFVLDYAPSYQLLAVLFTLAGTITGMEYAIVAQTMPPALTGRAATGLNLLIFLGAFAVQAGFGMLIGCWRPNLLQQYPAAAYRTGFGVLIALQLAGLVRHLRRRAPWTGSAFG
ncbi:MFS transporter [Rugamonas sp.]|uniref:MFS transporter n=1 Tax=Rugamonas sp. TaxID=1926287 RepID=UPI0025EEB3EA|nr:MFS transporter [Rugamonas sp.]